MDKRLPIFAPGNKNCRCYSQFSKRMSNVCKQQLNQMMV